MSRYATPTPPLSCRIAKIVKQNQRLTLQSHPEFCWSPDSHL